LPAVPAGHRALGLLRERVDVDLALGRDHVRVEILRERRLVGLVRGDPLGLVDVVLGVEDRAVGRDPDAVEERSDQ
jgi:hypothetical protein